MGIEKGLITSFYIISIMIIMITENRRIIDKYLTSDDESIQDSVFLLEKYFQTTYHILGKRIQLSSQNFTSFSRFSSFCLQTCLYLNRPYHKVHLYSVFCVCFLISSVFRETKAEKSFLFKAKKNPCFLLTYFFSLNTFSFLPCLLTVQEMTCQSQRQLIHFHICCVKRSIIPHY